MFYALSTDERKQLKDKVNLFIALSPVTRVGNLKSPLIKGLLPFYNFLDWWNNLVGWYELFGEPHWNHWFKTLCRSSPLLCYYSEGITYTSNVTLDSQERVEVLIGHQPGGVGLKDLFHFG